MAGLVRYARRGRAGRGLLASFLAVEIVFYVGHNLTGALGRDMPASNPILLIASVLGYINLVAAVAAFVYILRDRSVSVPADAAHQRKMTRDDEH